MNTEQIAVDVSLRHDLARDHLLQMMEARGLRPADGWGIAESVRHVEGGTELVLRPLHLRHDPPLDLECIVKIHSEDGAVRLEHHGSG
jgi:hypothetical protein